MNHLVCIYSIYVCTDVYTSPYDFKRQARYVNALLNLPFSPSLALPHLPVLSLFQWRLQEIVELGLTLSVEGLGQREALLEGVPIMPYEEFTHFLVTSKYGGQVIVKRDLRECSCGDMREMRLPCRHVLLVAQTYDWAREGKLVDRTYEVAEREEAGRDVCETGSAGGYRLSRQRLIDSAYEVASYRATWAHSCEVPELRGLKIDPPIYPPPLATKEGGKRAREVWGDRASEDECLGEGGEAGEEGGRKKRLRVEETQGQGRGGEGGGLMHSLLLDRWKGKGHE